MKVNKLFGVKSITNLIYGLLLLAPFVAILSRVIYVQSNDYAKDSYYGETINEKEEIFTSISNLKQNKRYLFKQKTYSETITGSNVYITYENMDWKQGNLTTGGNPSFTINETNSLLIYIPTPNRISYEFYKDDNRTDYYQVNGYTTYIEFEYTYLFLTDVNSTNLNYFNNNYEIVYNKYSYLDNAFEYSLYTFVQDNDVQSIDFFSWFTNMFLNQDNTHNALYLNFANWYLNYTLLVSSGYLLFFALMWFINYVRKILEKSSYHDFGGF